MCHTAGNVVCIHFATFQDPEHAIGACCDALLCSATAITVQGQCRFSVLQWRRRLEVNSSVLEASSVDSVKCLHRDATAVQVRSAPDANPYSVCIRGFPVANRVSCGSTASHLSKSDRGLRMGVFGQR